MPMTRSEEPQKPGETKNRANKKRQKLEDKSQARKPKVKKLDWKTFFPPIPPKKNTQNTYHSLAERKSPHPLLHEALTTPQRRRGARRRFSCTAGPAPSYPR